MNVNKLVIVGNGFDLAHGLKTGYDDFIISYITTCLYEAEENGVHKDDLFDITYNGRPFQQFPKKFTNKGEWVEYLFRNRMITKIFSEEIRFSGEYMHFGNPFDVKVTSDFFKKLLEFCCDASWAGIEHFYYKQLKLCVGDISGYIDKPGLLADINNTMTSLVQELKKYLVGESASRHIDIEDLLFDGSDNLTVRTGESRSILFLNFNYTHTITDCVQSVRLPPGYQSSVNYIHGNVTDSKNQMVFGYGDEMDDHYQMMEHSELRGYFKHIKSFAYFKTKNYSKLLNFLESADKFDISIWGHSCGLSDRVLLNKLFEHPRCRKIKIFYHDCGDGTDNFTELTESIARHFKNKDLMRDRIVNKMVSRELPQLS